MWAVLQQPFGKGLLEGLLIVVEQGPKELLVRVKGAGRVEPLSGTLLRGDGAGNGPGHRPANDGEVVAQRVHFGEVGRSGYRLPL
jgi:hypothetical protein